MSESEKNAAELSPAEVNIGKALVLLHRAAGRLDDASRRGEVRNALSQAAGFIEAARQAHEGAGAALPPGTHEVATSVDGPVAAVIAAAISVYLDRPFRLVSLQTVTLPIVPHLNVWSVEGRTQIFMSHRVR